MESESGENVECLWMLRKPLLVCFCVVVWVFFSVFSIFRMTSFGVFTRSQHQETTKIFSCLTRQKKRMRITRLFFVTDLEKESVQQRVKETSVTLKCLPYHKFKKEWKSYLLTNQIWPCLYVLSLILSEILFLSLLLPIISTWRCPTRKLLLLWTLYTNELNVF